MIGRRAAQALTLAAATVAGLALAEAGLRFWPGAWLVEADLYRKADDGSLELRPNLRRRHFTPAWDVEIRTDRDGWRDFERGPATKETAVLGLGDSFAFGWGVELAETFYSLLEAEAARPVRLWKAGVPGTGTLDQRRLAERLLANERALGVVLAFYVGNDFTDVALGGAGRYEVVDGLLFHAPGEGARTSAERRILLHSRFLQLIRAAQFRLLGKGPAAGGGWDEAMKRAAEIHLADPPARARQAVEATLAELDALAAVCERHGARLLVVVLPRAAQVEPAEERRLAEALGVAAGALDLDAPQRRLAAWARERGVAFVDVLPELRQRAARGGPALYFSPDSHLTPAGHRAVAEAARTAFEAWLLEI